jgi:hypothetical protein
MLETGLDLENTLAFQSLTRSSNKYALSTTYHSSLVIMPLPRSRNVLRSVLL